MWTWTTGMRPLCRAPGQRALRMMVCWDALSRWELAVVLILRSDEREDEQYADDEVELIEDDDDERAVKELEEMVPTKARRGRGGGKRGASALTGADPDAIFPLGDFSNVALLNDHTQRPLWVTEEGLYVPMRRCTIVSSRDCRVRA